MPYLALRTNKTLTLSQEVELKTTVGKLITVFPGESVDTFMIHIEDNQLIYFKGQEANCMMITLYLKGHYTDEQKERNLKWNRGILHIFWNAAMDLFIQAGPIIWNAE